MGLRVRIGIRVKFSIGVRVRITVRVGVRVKVNPKLNLTIIIILVRRAVPAKINISRINFKLTLNIKIISTCN